MNDQLEQTSGQPTPTKSALNKGLIFGLVAVIVVLLVAVIYLLTTKPAVSPVVVNGNLTKNQEQIVDNNQSPIADWKTYKNEKYGFELTLTDAWKGYTFKFDDGLLGDGGSQTLRFYVPTKDPKYSGDLAGYASPFRITVYLKSAWQAVLDDSPHPTYIAEKNGYVFTYSQWQDAPTDLQNKNFEIPKILSTFKFTNQNETASWKTYKNEKYGFELKYPSNLVVQENSNSAGLQVWFEQKNEATFFIQIKKAQLTSSVNLSNYFYMDFEPKSQTTLAGQTANVYEAPNGYCDGPGCSNPFVAVVTGKGNDVYILQFNGDIQISSIEKQILNSVKFNN